MNKRGISGKLILVLVVIGVIILASLITLRVWHSNCTASEDDGWFKRNILLCENESIGPIDNLFNKITQKIYYNESDKELGLNETVRGPVAWAGNALGFNQTLYEFFWPDLPWGLLVGLWIFVSFLIVEWGIILSSKGFLSQMNPISKKGELAKLKSSWLFFIGSKFWKIIPVGIAIAVLLQVPILSAFIEIITFEFLGVGWFIESIIFAFYLGLLPGAIEAYSRYRMRMKYYKQIVKTKYGLKTIKSAAEA